MSKRQRPTTIGPQTLVDFPRFGISGVPAKVDTGADSSSIWASNIKERAGRLTFTLFGPHSPFYTGEVITTRDYEIASIKNSFGNTEFRYKVKIKAVIEGRVITARFSLANRASNTFPILIGRRTLHGRFLVDVSSRGSKKYFRVLVFNEKSTNIKPVRKLFKTLEKNVPDARFVLSDYGNLKFIIDDNGINAQLADSHKSLSDFDLIYFKTSLNSRDIATAVASYADSQNIAIINRGVMKHFTNNKLKQYIVLSSNGIRLPKVYFQPLEKLEKSYSEIAKLLGVPFVLKDILGKKGRDNFLIEDRASFKRACAAAKAKGLEMVAQQFVPNSGDYRLLVMGSQVRMIIHRKAAEGTHVNNTSAGAMAKLLDRKEIPGPVHRMAVEAARAMELDIAGVDMMQDEDAGEWYCLEVNAGPQLATGAYVGEKETELSEYLQRRLSKLF